MVQIPSLADFYLTCFLLRKQQGPDTHWGCICFNHVKTLTFSNTLIITEDFNWGSWGISKGEPKKLFTTQQNFEHYQIGSVCRQQIRCYSSVDYYFLYYYHTMFSKAFSSRVLIFCLRASACLTHDLVVVSSIPMQLRQTCFPAYFCFSPLKYVRKVVGGFGKKAVLETHVHHRKP